MLLALLVKQVLVDTKAQQVLPEIRVTQGPADFKALQALQGKLEFKVRLAHKACVESPAHGDLTALQDYKVKQGLRDPQALMVLPAQQACKERLDYRGLKETQALPGLRVRLALRDP